MTVTTETPGDDTAASTTHRRGRARVLAAVVVVAVLVVGVVLWRVVGPGSETEPGSTTTPYDDPQAAGLITLCSADGAAVTGGRTDDTPFAAVALGETALPSRLDPVGAVVTLFGYQPREGVGPEEFSGIPLTAAGPLADPGRPAVGITEDVYSVGDFVAAFPATWDGFVQLRLYLGTPAVGTLTETPYDTADLRVDGDRWELVRGGSASCAGAVP